MSGVNGSGSPRVLVTGGAGFVGYHLAGKLLEKGYSVDVLDNLSRGRKDEDLGSLVSKGVRIIECDLTSGEVFELEGGYDYIYHLAAVIGVERVLAHPERVLKVNTQSLLNILEWAVRTCPDLKRFFFSSTSEVYAGTQRHYGIKVPTGEDTPLVIDDVKAARTTYALTKIFGENACYVWRKKYSLPITVVRYHNVYGPRMGFKHVIPELMVRAFKGKEYLEVFSPGHTRSFCYVEDAVEQSIRLAESPGGEGETVHVGNGEEEITIEELAERIIELVNPGLEIRPGKVHEGSPPRRCPDTAKMEKLIGYSNRVPLDKGLELTWAWYKEHMDDIYE